MRLTAAALLLIVPFACSVQEVQTEQDWDADFARYRTYAWRQKAAARDPSTEDRVRAAVDVELGFKGLDKVEPAGSPDLHVSSYASAEETLVIDLVDATSGKLVWRGLAAQAVDSQDSEATLRKAVRDIFRHYPRQARAPGEQ